MERSLELAGLTQSEHGLETIMHLTCTNMEKGTVDIALRVRRVHCYRIVRSYDLQAAKERGIENILALRGGAKHTRCYVSSFLLVE